MGHVVAVVLDGVVVRGVGLAGDEGGQGGQKDDLKGNIIKID